MSMSSYRLYECVSAMEEVSLLELISSDEPSSSAPPLLGRDFWHPPAGGD